ncbi:hypothetical protein MNBD_GAMMA18-2119 [hydrothermal vent metagenome]|uniref:DUF5610 domain-containing protein n=1 Tax=hydrothermal vent metagenome TaxID=652676 RepID=A0A3B0ZLJ0_9ZZZZ
MAISSIHNPAAQADIQQTKHDKAGSSKEPFSQAAIAKQTKTSMNIAILQASEAQLGVKDQPLSLLYKSAIENLNEMLAPELGENAIQNAYESGIDFSPEATAERIVSFATGFLPNYQENNPELAGNEALDGFMDLMGGAIQKGFDEARGILESLQVLEGNVASGIDQTYQLIQQGLADFRGLMSSTDEE